MGESIFTSNIKKKNKTEVSIHSVSSVTHSRLTLCSPMNCKPPGFPVHHQLPELAQTHDHGVGDSIQPSHPLSSPFSSHLQPFPASESFQMSQLFPSESQSIGVSASASDLTMNIQDRFPLGWTGWISLQSRSQESSPAPQFKSINSLALSFPHSPTLTSIHDHWKNQSFD